MSAIGAHLQEAVERAKILASRMATMSPGIKRSSGEMCQSNNSINNALIDTENVVKRSRSSEDDCSSKSSSATSSPLSSTNNLNRVDLSTNGKESAALRNRKINIVLGPEIKILAENSDDENENNKTKLEQKQARDPNQCSVQQLAIDDKSPAVDKPAITSSPTTDQQSPITDQPSPTTDQQSPITDQPTTPVATIDKSISKTTSSSSSLHEQQIAGLNHTLFNDSILPQSDLLIPQQFVGLVIGKGGENIRRVQNETGATLYIDSSKMADTEGNKRCTITGSVDSVQRASALVQEIIESAKIGRQTTKRKVNDGELEYRMKIPAAKTGVIIGRGGDTIRAIRSQTQCTIELDKDAVDCGPDEKVFVIMGPSDRVQQAQELINARLASCLQTRPNSYQTRQHPTCSPNMSSQSSAALQYGNNLYSAYWQQHMAAQSAQHDPSAAWAAYYAQYYASHMQTANFGLLQDKNNPSDSGGKQASSDELSNQANSSDYSSQWAQYYRAHGMIKEAEWIEQQ